MFEDHSMTLSSWSYILINGKKCLKRIKANKLVIFFLKKEKKKKADKNKMMQSNKDSWVDLLFTP